MNLVLQTLDAGILTITLNRPDKLNALSMETLETLSIIFKEAKKNSSVKGILLTGSGKAFCAGADVQRLKECTDANSAYEFALFGQSVMRELEDLGKPSIAAINGYAFGGGCELALAATLRVASITAQLAQPEIKLGIIPGFGGTQRLARLVGKGRALDLCLTGRTIDASTALSWGLVCEVVEPELLMNRALELLQGILAFAPKAITSVMEVIDHGYNLSLPDALHLEAIHFARIGASHDKREGITAFLEKRQAVFTGE